VTPDLARGQARPLGQAIFGGWLVPFELLSVLLLAALVAALAVSRGVHRR
jgi:NADH-quinone oxidoreductase subunit J